MEILLLGILLFFIIFFAVRWAISPLIPQEKYEEQNMNDFNLVKLRDIGVFDNNELEEVIRLFGNRQEQNEYDRYKKILYDLYRLRFLDDETYEEKQELLYEYYKQRNE